MPTSWLSAPVRPLAVAAQEQAKKRLANMGQPPRSLGVLEESVIRLAGMLDTPEPTLDPARIVLFAADHGVATANVSAQPQEKTWVMVRNALEGRSAIAVMARHLGIEMEVVDVGMMLNTRTCLGLFHHRAGSGTHDIRFRPAMDEEQMARALEAGRQSVERAQQDDVRIFIGGEIGVGKSTSAGAVVCALLGIPPEAVAGPGSGLDPAGLKRKSAAIQTSLDLHLPGLNQPIQVLRRLGGFEMAALCGAFITCGQLGIPILVDGLTASAAALIGVSIHPALKHWLLFGHRSAEPGQLSLLRAMGGQPILQLDMSLGEGTGATAALALLRMACVLQREISFHPED